eukprot:TRINITY_DN4024_c0_g4_i1.p1 TRINITY_DN4024_c0_g4~~TRINITY_DN4024_c0_g4_i1.p1  ORF type:complete len:369 (+),score=81.76 TRINITY_DN4024_c0_g4_i1:61-1167(+)
MATATASLLVKPASKEELEAFITANKRWLPEDAKQVLRDMTAVDQRRVISAGTMSSVRDPSAVIQARVRKAKELEVSLSRNGGVLPPDMTGQESRISKPATKEELEAFVRANDRWLQGEAAEILRSMSPVDQKRVISAGTMSGCRDPVAVIQTRAKKARELELELENLAAGKGSLKKEGSAPVTSTPSFCEAAAAAHLYAPPEEVDVSESRFARAVDAADLADNSSLAGESPGVGGVVEILKAKYGCFKGSRRGGCGRRAGSRRQQRRRTERNKRRRSKPRDQQKKRRLSRRQRTKRSKPLAKKKRREEKRKRRASRKKTRGRRETRMMRIDIKASERKQILLETKKVINKQVRKATIITKQAEIKVR